MLVLEYTLDAATAQYARLDEAIRRAQFIRNQSLRLWMDTPGTTANELQVKCSRLAKGFAFAASLNSPARQAAADRAWQAISRFSTNRFQHDNRSVEYKVTGWKLDPDDRHLTFTDGGGIGCVRRVRRVGTRSAASRRCPSTASRGYGACGACGERTATPPRSVSKPSGRSRIAPPASTWGSTGGSRGSTRTLRARRSTIRVSSATERAGAGDSTARSHGRTIRSAERRSNPRRITRSNPRRITSGRPSSSWRKRS